MEAWRFVANQNSTIYGINDAGIETFTADMNRSLVREMIQNSLDAVLPEHKGPVKVEFSMFEIATSNLPDVANLSAAVKMCKNSNHDEPDAYHFFQYAESLLSQNKIRILRISDYYTKGLEGSDTCEKGTGWSRLVKESGSSNKEQNSGGSFGIGKAAAFACSDLRTVFYSSLDKKGLKSNFGVAKLVSFKDPKMGWTTGTGYYSENERFVAIPKLAEFDSSYERKTSGTDVYILGAHQGEGFKQQFIKAVLLDFLVSIYRGKLVVKIQDETIDSNTLPKYMSKLNQYEDEQIKDLVEYYDLLASKDPSIIKINLDSKKYGKKYGFKDGECTLYLKEKEGLNRKILITRKAGMRIFEQDHINGSIEFTGILIIDGVNMNEAFKKMEVPSHDAWEPGRCRHDPELYTNIYKDLRKYLRAQVKENFGKISEDTIDAFGVSDFLPDKLIAVEAKKKQKTDFTTKVRELFGKKKAPTEKKTRQIDLVSVPVKENSGTEEKKIEKKEKKETKKANTIPQGTQPGERTGYVEIPVKKRVVCGKAKAGEYSIGFVVPSNAEKGKLVFTLSGEQSDFDLPIVSAKISSGEDGIKVSRIEGNVVYLEGLKKATNAKLDFKVDYEEYCMMEVDYFANKK